MKYFILVCDGMGDEPLTELNGQTPMEAARTPAMDGLAAVGELFTLATVPQGMAPGSDVANLSLLGYRPERFYSGRAPLEAASMNVHLAADETAFRCNLVTLTQEDEKLLMTDYSAGHISTPEAGELIAALAAELNNSAIHFYPGVSYRHLLVTRGEYPALHTTPPHDHTGREINEYWQRYQTQEPFAGLVNGAREILGRQQVNRLRLAAGKNPANAIWLWGEGKAPKMAKLSSHYGISGALISAVDLLKGIATYAGMEVITVPGATGYLDTNYQGKAQAALEAATRHDLIFVHVEAADEAGHQGLVAEKIQAIEDFDQKIVRPLLAALEGTEFRMAITPDHYTPVSLRSHIAKAVPLLIYDSRTSMSGGPAYNEQNAHRYGRRLANGEEFFNILL